MNRFIYEGILLSVNSLDICKEWNVLLGMDYFLGKTFFDFIDIEYSADGSILSFTLSFYLVSDKRTSLCIFSYSGYHKEFQLYFDENEGAVVPNDKTASVTEELKFTQHNLTFLWLYPLGEFESFHVRYSGFTNLGIVGDSYRLFNNGCFELQEEPDFPISGKSISVYGMKKESKNRCSSGINHWHVVA